MGLITVDARTERLVKMLHEAVNATYESAPLTDSEIIRMSCTVAFMFAMGATDVRAIFGEAMNDAKHKLIEPAVKSGELS